VRSTAASALGDIGDKKAVQPLANASRGDRDATVRKAASDALAEMQSGDN